jgi:hypothetical protein
MRTYPVTMRTDQGAVEEQGLHGVAGGWVVCLGVDDDGGRLRKVGAAVHIHMAHPLGVPKHRDARVCLHVPHERTRPTRQHQVNDVIQGQQLLGRRPPLHQADHRARHVWLKRPHQRLHSHLCAK